VLDFIFSSVVVLFSRLELMLVLALFLFACDISLKLTGASNIPADKAPVIPAINISSTLTLFKPSFKLPVKLLEFSYLYVNCSTKGCKNSESISSEASPTILYPYLRIALDNELLAFSIGSPISLPDKLSSAPFPFVPGIPPVNHSLAISTAVLPTAYFVASLKEAPLFSASSIELP